MCLVWFPSSPMCGIEVTKCGIGRPKSASLVSPEPEGRRGQPLPGPQHQGPHPQCSSGSTPLEDWQPWAPLWYDHAMFTPWSAPMLTVASGSFTFALSVDSHVGLLRICWVTKHIQLFLTLLCLCRFVALVYPLAPQQSSWMTAMPSFSCSVVRVWWAMHSCMI